MTPPRYMFCWQCGRRLTAGGKYARRVEVPDGGIVYTHATCEADARRELETAAPSDRAPDPFDPNGE